ncbi:type II secretion system protein [Planctomycetota bacterium]
MCPARSKRRTHNRGFTLVELLVVIGIMTLLAAIILPGMHTMKERARVVLCLNRLRQIGIAHLVYASDNKGGLPFNTMSPAKCGSWGVIRRWDAVQNKRAYFDQIWGLASGNANRTRRAPGKYLTDPRVFYCPGWIHHMNLKPGDTYYEWSSLRHVPDAMEEAFLIDGSSTAFGLMVYMQIGYSIFASGHTGATQPPYDTKEVPYRIHARQRRLSAASSPLCWVAADHGRDSVLPLPHYVGGYSKQLSFPYNVAHLDGHVDTHQIDPFTGGTDSTPRVPSMDWERGGGVPYGNTGWDNSPWTGLGSQVAGIDMEEDKK